MREKIFVGMHKSSWYRAERGHKYPLSALKTRGLLAVPAQPGVSTAFLFWLKEQGPNPAPLPTDYKGLRQHRLVEFFPIIQVIQIYSVFRGSAVIGQVVSAKNRFARRVIVNVTANRCVEFLDGSLIQFCRILFYPGFELAIGRLVLFDVVDHRVTIEADTVNDHLIIALAGAWIACRQLAGGFERKFEPKAGQMEHAQWTGHA